MCAFENFDEALKLPHCRIDRLGTGDEANERSDEQARSCEADITAIAHRERLQGRRSQIDSTRLDIPYRPTSSVICLAARLQIAGQVRLFRTNSCAFCFRVSLNAGLWRAC